MARLKIYTVRESRDSHLAQNLADMVGTGPHGQGDLYVAGYTKAAAVTRLAELGMTYSAAKLCVVDDVARITRRLWSLLTLPGDVAAWKAMGRVDAPIVRVRAGETEPAIAAHWRANPNHGQRAYPGVPAYMIRFPHEEDESA